MDARAVAILRRAAAAAAGFAAAAALGCALFSGGGWAPDAGERPSWPPPPRAARVAYLGQVTDSRQVTGGGPLWKRILVGSEETVPIGQPAGLAVDGAGRLYVADLSMGIVHRINLEGGDWTPLGSGRLAMPVDVAVDAGGERVLVSDPPSGAVLELREGEAPLRIGEGRLGRPAGVALDDGSGEVFVADVEACRVRVFGPDGRERRSFGGPGTGPGLLNRPVDILLDGRGVWVLDTLNGRVQLFDRTGRWLSSFGSLGDGSGSFARPRALASDRDGNLYVTDGLFDAVQVFDVAGTLLLGFGGAGTAAGQLWMPSGVAAGPGDRIYVSDTYNRRISVYEYRSLP